MIKRGNNEKNKGNTLKNTFFLLLFLSFFFILLLSLNAFEVSGGIIGTCPGGCACISDTSCHDTGFACSTGCIDSNDQCDGGSGCWPLCGCVGDPLDWQHGCHCDEKCTTSEWSIDSNPRPCAAGYKCSGSSCGEKLCPYGLIGPGDYGGEEKCWCGGRPDFGGVLASLGQYCCGFGTGISDSPCVEHAAFHPSWWTCDPYQNLIEQTNILPLQTVPNAVINIIDEETYQLVNKPEFGEDIDYHLSDLCLFFDLKESLNDATCFGEYSCQATDGSYSSSICTDISSWSTCVALDFLYDQCDFNGITMQCTGGNIECSSISGKTSDQSICNLLPGCEWTPTSEDCPVIYVGFEETQTFGASPSPNLNLKQGDFERPVIPFCDPDDPSGIGCNGCYLGYTFEDNLNERYWDETNKECCGDDFVDDTNNFPDFIHNIVDEPDSTEEFCNGAGSGGCKLGASPEIPDRRDWSNIARCCGDDDGNLHTNWNVDGENLQDLGDGFNNFNDCAKLTYNGDFLCNFQKTSSNQSEWYQATAVPGEIAYLPCNNFEAVSDGSTWIGCGDVASVGSCPNTESNNQFNGNFFQKEMRLSFIDGWQHSYFCISPPYIGVDTLYECCGTRDCKSDSTLDSEGGKQFSTGDSFVWPNQNGATYYCAYKANTTGVTNEVISDISTTSTLWTADLDLTNKNSCELAKDPLTGGIAGFVWTGKDEYHQQGDFLHNFCCSENDDNTLLESYEDPEGIGACFESIYQQNTNFVFARDHTFTEVYVLDGEFHGCALDDLAALDGFCSGPYGSCTGYKSYTLPGYYYSSNKPYDGSLIGGSSGENDFLEEMVNCPDPGYAPEAPGDIRTCSQLGGSAGDPSCEPDCPGDCGDDGCESCCNGICDGGTTSCTVEYGSCSETGTKTCSGTSLGSCAGTTDPRIANCAGNECGSNGCGGTCGTCNSDEECVAGNCIEEDDGGGDGCFLQGTKILTPKGEKAIEKLKAGDIIYSFDTIKNELVENIIKRPLVHKNYKDQGVILTLSNNEKLYVTLNHAFYSPEDKEFIQLEKFSKEKPFSYYDKITKQIEKVTIKTIRQLGHFKTEYNIELEKEPKNYFANGVIVHNAEKTGEVIAGTEIKPIALTTEPKPFQPPLITGYTTYGTCDALLIQDHYYCDIIDNSEDSSVGKYYCSYEETWKETEGINLTHLSFVEWPTGDGIKRAECCQPTECWNEEICTITQHSNALSPPFRSNTDGYRCIFGEWYYSYLKYDWDNIISGWCPRNDQCLVNPSGLYEEFNNPQCVDSGVFIGDHYCENGQWTSRTKFLALQLLQFVQNEDQYTLYCDDYTNTLNELNYTLFTAAQDYILYPRQERTGIQAFPSVNNFCILSYDSDNKIAIATSLNHPVDIMDPTNFLNIFEQEWVTCPTTGTNFQPCGGSNIHYNPQINSIIYSKEQISFQLPQQTILSYFQELFGFIFSWQPTYGFDLTFSFIQDTKDFKKIYVSNQEQIIAIAENVWPTTGKEYISVKYAGTGADICASIETYDDSLGEADYLQCEENQGAHYIVSGLPDGINLWPQLTSKLRPES